MSGVSKAVLITGCSTGIGRATALHLTRSGWNVYATARRVDSISDLADVGCHTLQLDVTDEASMREAVRRIEDVEGAVGVLVNNAGYGQSGALEEVAIEAARYQFEVNVFGAMALTQMVLPRMRDQRWGKVVNVGSMAGRLTLPGGGWYHATKHALESLSDALRFEVKGFGVDVVLIEPGMIATDFTTTTVGTINHSPDSPYREFNTRLAAVSEHMHTGPKRVIFGQPDSVAAAIEKALDSRRPRPRIPVTASAWLGLLYRRLLSDRAWDRLMRIQYPRPR